MSKNKVYIVIKILGDNNFLKFGAPIATTNYGVYLSQEKADKAIEIFMKENPGSKFMTESWEVE